jgi:hypothetical protein
MLSAGIGRYIKGNVLSKKHFLDERSNIQSYGNNR